MPITENWWLVSRDGQCARVIELRCTRWESWVMAVGKEGLPFWQILDDSHRVMYCPERYHPLPISPSVLRLWGWDESRNDTC
jgi:hypothetical protein